MRKLALMILAIAPVLWSTALHAQIDPVERQLVQFGYNGAFEGHPPQSIYAFYYLNMPHFAQTNLTLRLAIAPTYLDSELGISKALGELTDIGIGVAGGGFADNYNEIRGGTFYPSESFEGFGTETSLSLYHLFNPGHLIPLNGLLRGTVHYTWYDKNDDTAPTFVLPDDHATFSVRTGLRFGGREPTLYPDLAMELSVWYEGYFRTDSGTYGYGDRKVEPQSHLFWAEALLAYTFPESKQSFYLSMTAGTSLEADRLSAYRLGALLPLVSEFPLSLPGYYFQEISARQFILFGGNYILPLDKKAKWNLNVTATTAGVDYISGLEQPGDWHSGVGGGILYKSRSWKVMLGYAYGVDAIRSGGRGANSIGLLIQLDWGHAKESLYTPPESGRWRGLQQIFNFFGS